jgi:hypothetical protein
VEEGCVETSMATSGMMLAIHSSHGIDRMVTMYRAAIRSGRNLLLDLYAGRRHRCCHRP